MFTCIHGHPSCVAVISLAFLAEVSDPWDPSVLCLANILSSMGLKYQQHDLPLAQSCWKVRKYTNHLQTSSNETSVRLKSEIIVRKLHSHLVQGFIVLRILHSEVHWLARQGESGGRRNSCWVGLVCYIWHSLCKDKHSETRPFSKPVESRWLRRLCNSDFGSVMSTASFTSRWRGFQIPILGTLKSSGVFTLFRSKSEHVLWAHNLETWSLSEWSERYVSMNVLVKMLQLTSTNQSVSHYPPLTNHQLTMR